jgi:hypothetical protein
MGKQNIFCVSEKKKERNIFCNVNHRSVINTCSFQIICKTGGREAIMTFSSKHPVALLHIQGGGRFDFESRFRNHVYPD